MSRHHRLDARSTDDFTWMPLRLKMPGQSSLLHAGKKSGATPPLVDEFGIPGSRSRDLFLSVDQLTPEEIKAAQDLDLTIGPVKAAVEAGRVPTVILL